MINEDPSTIAAPAGAHVVGVDFGTLSGRAVVVRVSDGAELATATFDYPHAVVVDHLPGDTRALPPEWALQVPQDYVDVLRNAPAQHAVAPYTLRPKPGAPVAVPLRWDEVDAGWRPQSTPLASLFRRLGSLSSDPWAGFDEARVPAATIAERLQALHPPA